MSQLGLTHGGFYGHFEGKDDLVAATVSRMFEEIAEYRAKSIAGAPRGKELAAIVNSYLSEAHRDHPESGCLISALAPEIARQSRLVRQAYTKGFNSQIDKLAEYMPGADLEERRRNARILISGMSGTMAIARAVSDRELSDKILAQGREFYASAFAGHSKNG
jgi:TetR/AcrR family transcriptional regulator, transcriptional repressor for nem operon